MRSWIYKGFAIGFFAVVSLFFLWALANSLNDILIRQFQKALDLSRGESGFLQFVFYLGYFLVALPAGLLIRRVGYRGGILVGLGLYALGALSFYPAAEIREFWAFLVALFVIASGLAILETAANPMIARFGPQEKAAQRLNFAQAFNGLGAFVAPIIGGLFIFSGVELDASQAGSMTPLELDAYRANEALMVQGPYLSLALAIALVAAIIAVVKLPQMDESNAEQAPAEAQGAGLFQALRLRHLRWAVVAQFFYVGAQVVIWSFFVDFAIDFVPGVSERQAAFYLSISLASFMVGRFVGTALMSRIAPATLLGVFAICAAILSLGARILDGAAALVSLGAVSFFMSIMFPTIFALGIDGAGIHTKTASSFIIMAIIGGAIFPPLAGFLADYSGNIAVIGLFGAASFAVIGWFAWRYPSLRASHVESGSNL